MNDPVLEVVLYLIVAAVCAAGLLFSAWTMARCGRNRSSAERIQILTAQPGDAVVITYPGTLTQDQRMQIIKSAERRLPDGVIALVLDGGLCMSHVVSVNHAPGE